MEQSHWTWESQELSSSPSTILTNGVTLDGILCPFGSLIWVDWVLAAKCVAHGPAEWAPSGSLLEMQVLRSHPSHLLNQSLNVNKIPMGFVCALKFDRRWPIKPSFPNSIWVQSFTYCILLANCLPKCPMMHRSSGRGMLLILIGVDEWKDGRGILDNVTQKKTEKVHVTLGAK